MRLPLLASRINLIDLSLPTVIGITTPGNNTVLRKGNMDNTSGICSLFISSSSSVDISGKNSESSFIIGKAFLKSNGSKLIKYPFCLFKKRHNVSLQIYRNKISGQNKLFSLSISIFQDLCQVIV